MLNLLRTVVIFLLKLLAFSVLASVVMVGCGHSVGNISLQVIAGISIAIFFVLCFSLIVHICLLGEFRILPRVWLGSAGDFGKTSDGLAMCCEERKPVFRFFYWFLLTFFCQVIVLMFLFSSTFSIGSVSAIIDILEAVRERPAHLMLFLVMAVCVGLWGSKERKSKCKK